jgi:hypothetical protein
MGRAVNMPQGRYQRIYGLPFDTPDLNRVDLGSLKPIKADSAYLMLRKKGV